VAKAIGRPLAKLAARVMSGETLAEVGLTEEIIPSHVAVKEAVLPFNKFPGTDTLLGPEMRSTGEVMGLDSSFGKSFAKAESGAGEVLPLSGTAFVSVIDRDKEAVVPIIKDLQSLGFKILATYGTYKFLKAAGITSDLEAVLKISEGRPNVLDVVKNQRVQLIINTPSGEDAQAEGQSIRRTALGYKIPIVTTLAGARATAAAIRALQDHPLEVKALQDYFV
jgi:carbamoyl-phosphate synthase large subunit